MSVTDAVNSGIVLSAEDSGKDNVHAQLEPGRFHRQISMFHEIFRFKKLGVPFEDTPEGRKTAAGWSCRIVNFRLLWRLPASVSIISASIPRKLSAGSKGIPAL